MYNTAIQTHAYIIIILVVETTTPDTTNTTGLKWITCNFYVLDADEWLELSLLRNELVPKLLNTCQNWQTTTNGGNAGFEFD